MIPDMAFLSLRPQVLVHALNAPAECRSELQLPGPLMGRSARLKQYR